MAVEFEYLSLANFGKRRTRKMNLNTSNKTFIFLEVNSRNSLALPTVNTISCHSKSFSEGPEMFNIVASCLGFSVNWVQSKTSCAFIFFSYRIGVSSSLQTYCLLWNKYRWKRCTTLRLSNLKRDRELTTSYMMVALPNFATSSKIYLKTIGYDRLLCRELDVAMTTAFWRVFPNL